MSKEKFVDHYKTLGVQFGADKKAIKKAYRKLSLKYHPDRNKAPAAAAKFIELTKSFELLKDEDKRQKFDKTVKTRYKRDIRNQKREKRSRDLRDDLVRREHAAAKKTGLSPGKKARMQTIQQNNAKLCELYEKETAKDLTTTRIKLREQRRGVVFVKWKRKHCPQSEIRLRQRFLIFGAVVKIRMMDSGRSALVFFESQYCAQNAVSNSFVDLKVSIPENEQVILESIGTPKQKNCTSEQPVTSPANDPQNNPFHYFADDNQDLDLESQEDDIFARLKSRGGSGS